MVKRFLKPQVCYATTNRFLAGHAGRMKFVPGVQKEVGLSEYDEHNQKLGRPMSPISIYNVELTSLLSISNRVCAAGFTFGVYATCCYVMMCGDFYTALARLPLTPTSHLILKGIILFPFLFHVLAGVRHLYWDSGHGLNMKFTYVSGYLMIFVLILSFYGLLAL